MNVIGGKASTLSAAVRAQLGQFGQARFDHGDALHVMVQDDAGRITGYAGLLPTDRPYPLRERFPELLRGLPAPCSADVWELARFAAVDLDRRSSAAVPQAGAPIAQALLRAAVECAGRHGARRLLMAAPIGIERLMRRAGLHSHRAGPPQLVDGHPVFACWIEIDAGD